MTTLELRKIGNSIGVVIPTEMLSFLRAGVGDTVHVTPSNGGLRLTPYDPVFEKKMSAMRTVMRKNRNALRELAK